MARETFNSELGYGIYAENGDIQALIISGTLVPDGVSGKQGDAPIGSIYLRSGTGELYQKIANAGAPADWELNGSSSVGIGTWRGEQVVLVTNDTQGAGTRDVVANPFSDDDGTAVPLSQYVVGRYIISDADGTPALLEITNVVGDDVTFAVAGTPLSNQDTFTTRFYLPDSPDSQEGQAIVQYDGSIVIKIGDIDFSFATGIDLSGAYSAASGDVASGDTVELAIEKLDGNNDAQDSLLGTSQGDTDLGLFPNNDVIPDNSSVKDALDAVAQEAEGQPSEQTGVNSATTLDSVLVDSYRSVAWLVTAFDEANPADVKSAIVHGANNGTTSADATLTDDNASSLLQSGVFNTQIAVVLSGTGAAQEMVLQVNSSEPGVTFTAIRLGAAPSGY
jgi:hypothetical protein